MGITCCVSDPDTVDTLEAMIASFRGSGVAEVRLDAIEFRSILVGMITQVGPWGLGVRFGVNGSPG